MMGDRADDPEEKTRLRDLPMYDMMSGSGMMMWGMGAIGLLVLIVLILLAAALIKYLFFQ
jgi:hypothetical protein